MPRLERVLKVAILRRGVPEAVFVDNGQIYNAMQFRAACASLRIEVIFASPYHPQSKGKIEQFWHLVQESFYPEVAASQLTDLDLLNQSFWAWLERIYHARVHGETGQTPLDRFLAGAEHVRSADPETLRLAFQWRTKRKVTRQASLSLQGNKAMSTALTRPGAARPLSSAMIPLTYPKWRSTATARGWARRG